ncbi:MAG: helix-turn-helix domain-containing protein [Candidatus Sericytochromatia bacterium]
MNSEPNFESLQHSPPFVRKAFPDLGWLKAHTDSGAGWPTLIMNATASSSWRPDIRGPLTLFMNLSGTSRVTVTGYEAFVNPNVCFISNTDQRYSLEIDSITPVETFNLHIGRELLSQTHQSLVLQPERLLGEGGILPAADFCFPNRLEPREAALDAWIRRVLSLSTTLSSGPAQTQELEAAMLELLVWLLGRQAEIQREIARLPAVKAGTRQELHARLNRARDQLYAASTDILSLEELAATACMSKYHFLRLFRAAYGCTPHQFQLRLRIARAKALLKTSRLSVQEIALHFGFDDVSSFSRQFRSQVGTYPLHYRQQAG